MAVNALLTLNENFCLPLTSTYTSYAVTLACFEVNIALPSRIGITTAISFSGWLNLILVYLSIFLQTQP